MRKNLVFLLILITTIIFTQSGTYASASAPAASVAKDAVSSTIETSATSQLEVPPDISYINANITIINEDKAVASSINKTSTNNLIDALVAAKIAKTDIKTTGFYASAYVDRVIVDPQATNPVYKDVKKYQTTANFKITVRNVDSVGDIIDKMLSVDNVDISNVSYGVNNVAKYKKEAIKQAVDIAKENISFAAESAGVKLNKLQSLTVDFSNNTSQPYPIYSKAMDSASAPMYQNPENIKISASVHMVYTTK